MYSRAYVEVTNVCNMACSFCHGHSRQKGFMTKEEFAHILGQLRGITGYIYYHLMGEPLLHPLLGDFLDLAAEKGFKSVITTNGTLLPKVGELLLEKPLHKVSISLHSFEDADQEGHRRYLSGVADFAAKAAEQGIYVSLRLWNKGVDGGNNRQTEDFLRRYFADEWTANSRGYRLRDRLFLEWDDRFDWPDLEERDRGGSHSCYGLRNQFGILRDGSVVPCCLDSEGAITLGNVFRQPLAEILDSPRARAMVKAFQNRQVTEELCRRCGFATRF